jgi:hypothetical protein
MEKRIRKLYSIDCSFIIAFMIFLWTAMIYTMIVIISVVTGLSLRVLILGAGLVAGICATVALVAVLAHLKSQRSRIYAEDIMRSSLLVDQDQLRRGRRKKCSS